MHKVIGIFRKFFSLSFELWSWGENSFVVKIFLRVYWDKIDWRMSGKWNKTNELKVFVKIWSTLRLVFANFWKILSKFSFFLQIQKYFKLYNFKKLNLFSTSSVISTKSKIVQFHFIQKYSIWLKFSLKLFSRLFFISNQTLFHKNSTNQLKAPSHSRN